MTVSHFLTRRGVNRYQVWLDELADIRGRIAILRRIDRLAGGNFGDHKFLGEGVSELRIDFGPGYRVYYAQPEQGVVLLLWGGLKRTQVRDIKQAIRFWIDYQRRA